MKHLPALFFAMGALLVACNDEPEVAPAKLPLLESDSLALIEISKELDTDAEGYPVRWSPADRSTWKEIRLDTITDEATGKQCLAVTALTVYQTKQGQETPSAISWMHKLKKLNIYGCAGSIVNPYVGEPSVSRLLIDRLDPNDKGFMKLISGRHLFLPDNSLLFLTVHGLDITSFDIAGNRGCNYDLSYNNIEGIVPSYLLQYPWVNLSHNKLTLMEEGLDRWLHSNRHIPNLQYNNIEIPAEVTDTYDWGWRMYHEMFVGNPGYRVPVE